MYIDVFCPIKSRISFLLSVCVRESGGELLSVFKTLNFSKECNYLFPSLFLKVFIVFVASLYGGAMSENRFGVNVFN